MNENTCIDLSLLAYQSQPFPHFTSASAFHYPLDEKLYDWFEQTNEWYLSETDFYDQFEFNLLNIDLPEALKRLVSDETITNIKQHFIRAFAIESLELVGVMAHKLVNGQKIGIHNDYINEDETHRLVIHINQEWKEDNGGFLMLFDSANVEDVSKVVYPLNNFAFGFEISKNSHHAVSKIYNFCRYTLIYTFRKNQRMSLPVMIRKFVNNPFPLWENELAKLMVRLKFDAMESEQAHSNFKYSTAGWLNPLTNSNINYYPISKTEEKDIIYLEEPFFDGLKDFYTQHGLYPCTYEEIISGNALVKLNEAMSLIRMVPGVSKCISTLVRCIQILKQEDEEIDISYSHPNIPFSIFVSVCKDTSIVSNLRVAESIIHETMHLKLTLIEKEASLVKANTGNLFFSPWRDEERPAQGVLHGLFVFRAILEFYRQLKGAFEEKEVVDFLEFRQEKIMDELMQLNNFHLCPDLTKYGAILTINLLPSN